MGRRSAEFIHYDILHGSLSPCGQPEGSLEATLAIMRLQHREIPLVTGDPHCFSLVRRTHPDLGILFSELSHLLIKDFHRI